MTCNPSSDISSNTNFTLNFSEEPRITDKTCYAQISIGQLRSFKIAWKIYIYGVCQPKEISRILPGDFFSSIPDLFSLRPVQDSTLPHPCSLYNVVGKTTPKMCISPLLID